MRTEVSLFSYVTDRTVSLRELRRFVNRVAGRIRRTLPHAILSASLKARACGGAPDSNGVILGGSCKGREAPLTWYEDAALVAAGGDRLGTLSMHQIQFYPLNAFGPSSSPFRYDRAAFCRLHRIDCSKPIMLGEFPMTGLVDLKSLPGSALSLADAYEQLWRGRLRGRLCVAGVGLPLWAREPRRRVHAYQCASRRPFL